MFANIYRKIENGFLVGLMVVSTLTVSYAVFMRYIMHAPLTWSEELVCYFQIWIAFIGISCVARNRDGFIRFDFLLHKMGPRLRTVIFFVEHGIMIFFMLLMVVVSTKWLLQIYQYGGISTPMMVPNFIPRISVPLSFLLMLIHFVERVISEIVRLRGKVSRGGNQNEY